MARHWFLDGILDSNQRVPAALIVHGFEAMETGEPARHFTVRHYPQAFPAYGWQHASFSAGCAAAAAIYYWVGFWCLLVPVAVGAPIAILTEED